MRALFSNETDDPDELVFSCDDVLDVVEEVNVDWLICRLGDESGLVPRNYVEDT